jgi:hypothetical protein
MRSILAYDLPPVFTVEDVKRLEPEDNVRHCQMRRAMVRGDIIRIRRGYYTLNTEYQRGLPSGFVLAQKFVPDSYISMETALSDIQWIPEAVYVVGSTTNNKKQTLKTVYGLYLYYTIPQKDLYAGTVRNEYLGEYYREAKPLKALADYVYYRKEEWTTLDPLVNSLRIEIDDLETLRGVDFNELEGNYESSLVEKFLSGIRKELRV